MWSSNELDTMQFDCIEIATEIAEWCERNYGYFIKSKSNKIKTIEDFATQLCRLTPLQLNQRQKAMHCYFDSGVSHPPLPTQIIKLMRELASTDKDKLAMLTHKIEETVQIDWSMKWKISTHEEKITFFEDNPPRGISFSDVPAFIQYEAKKYYIKEAGMTPHDASQWIKRRC